MNREGLEACLLLYVTNPSTAPGNITIRTIATHFWDARQPEVDNLLARIGALSASNTKWKEIHNDLTKRFISSQQENCRLKAEVARGTPSAELDKVKL